MSKQNPNKRALKFETFDEIHQDVQSLIEANYLRHGKWNLSQALGHLNEWARFPMDGFPTPPLPLRMMFWVMSKTVGPGMKRKILENGFSDGMPTAPQTVPAPNAATDRAAAEKFRSTLNRLKDYSGPLHPSPLFGPMDREMAITVTRLHAAHHLGFFEARS